MSSCSQLGRGNRRGFATTRWSLVLAAGGESTEDSRRALEELCSQYWYPLYSYTRRRGYSANDASDLTQAFFVKLLKKKDIGTADANRGRFRTFLLTAMKNFLAGEWRKQNTLKRGGAFHFLSLDFDSAEASYQLEPSHELSPEAVYERRWAMSILETAVNTLQKQYSDSGKSDLFEAFKGSLGGDGEVLPYSQLSKSLGLTEGALRTAASRMRSRWRKRLRELVAPTVSSESEIQDELRSLIASVEPDV